MAIKRIGPRRWAVDVAYRRDDGKPTHIKVTVDGGIQDAVAAEMAVRESRRGGSLTSTTIDALIDQYWRVHGACGNESHLAILAAAFRGVVAGEEAVAAVDTYRAQQSGRVTDATINRRLACLRAVLNWAVRRRMIPANPVGVWEFRRETPRTRTLTTREGLRLLAVLRSRRSYLYPAVRFAVRNPIRAGDLFGLTAADIDLENGWVSVRAGKTDAVAHYLVWDACMRDYLRAAKARGGYVFPGADGVSRVGDYHKHWSTVCRRARVTGFRFHDLRRVAATWMLGPGEFRVEHLQRLGIWRTMTTIMRHYYAAGPSDIRDEVLQKRGAAVA